MKQLRRYTSLRERVKPHAFEPRRSDYRLVDRIRKSHALLKSMSVKELNAKTDQLREQIASGVPILSYAIVVPAFALMTEAIRRTQNKVFYDVQLLAGLVLGSGAIAEMQTGEGKTLVTALPAFLHSLTGHGVHVGTTNSYLAARDFAELKPAFTLLGVTVGLLEEQGDFKNKDFGYKCDITWGTGYEYGFDFLKDQLALRRQPQLPLGMRHRLRLRGAVPNAAKTMQQGHSFSVIDEADSVLIDEATTPLVLSGSNGEMNASKEVYDFAHNVSDQVSADSDFVLDHVKRTVKLTADGWARIHSDLPANVTQQLRRPWSQYVEHALRAKYILKRDVDYVVVDDEVRIVDPNTGRIHSERTWRSGMHQAVETRAGAELTTEKESMARISRQRYYQFYEASCGMTGTATGTEREMREFYQLPVVTIPLNKPSQRRYLGERFFASDNDKFHAIASDVDSRFRSGQPILIGTRTIEQSHMLSQVLKRKSIKHTVLNGVQDEDEAVIVSRAGKDGAVTIATNMAGRGTDIKLSTVAREAGGLHVIVAEHHDSHRVDRQLIGRSARQGDPGSCQFFSSANDTLLRGDDQTLAERFRSASNSDGESSTDFSQNIVQLQNEAEERAYEHRRQMVDHDYWMETVLKTVASEA
ncbi:preprotein translocase subunit SecA [bacterium]|nr:preprotein translocase subunit SecA [bacterium]